MSVYISKLCYVHNINLYYKHCVMLCVKWCLVYFLCHKLQENCYFLSFLVLKRHFFFLLTAIKAVTIDFASMCAAHILIVITFCRFLLKKGKEKNIYDVYVQRFFWIFLKEVVKKIARMTKNLYVYFCCLPVMATTI